MSKYVVEKEVVGHNFCLSWYKYMKTKKSVRLFNDFDSAMSYMRKEVKALKRFVEVTEEGSKACNEFLDEIKDRKAPKKKVNIKYIDTVLTDVVLNRKSGTDIHHVGPYTHEEGSLACVVEWNDIREASREDGVSDMRNNRYAFSMNKEQLCVVNCPISIHTNLHNINSKEKLYFFDATDFYSCGCVNKEVILTLMPIGKSEGYRIYGYVA